METTETATPAVEPVESQAEPPAPLFTIDLPHFRKAFDRILCYDGVNKARRFIKRNLPNLQGSSVVQDDVRTECLALIKKKAGRPKAPPKPRFQVSRAPIATPVGESKPQKKGKPSGKKK